MNCDHCKEPFAEPREHVKKNDDGTFDQIPFEWNEIHYKAKFNGRWMDVHGVCYRELDEGIEEQLCLENGRHEELEVGEACWACGFTR